MTRDRHLLLAFSFCVALAILWQRLMADPTEGVGVAAGGLGAAEALGLAALFLTAWRLGADRVLRNVDLLLIAMASFAFVIPSLNVAASSLLVVGLSLVWRREPRLASFGQILLALLFFEVLGKLVFDMLAGNILQFEASLVSGALASFGDFHGEGLSITAPNGHSIMIETRCSAFHNVSTATLLWLSLIKIERHRIERRDWIVLSAMVASSVVANTVRIALMAQSRSMYDYWHNGAGVNVFSVTALASMLAIFLGARLIGGDGTRPFAVPA